MSDSKNKNIKYEDYLKTLTKEEIGKTLNTFKIDYKKSDTKEALIGLVLANLPKIVGTMLSYFQLDEYQSMKYMVKKGGVVKIKVNYLLQNFLENLARHHVVIRQHDNKYILPNEIYKIFKTKINNKGVLNKAKENTSEYSLILGITDTYGAYLIKDFYQIYKEKYNISEENFEKRISELSIFYDEYKVYTDNKAKESYIASKEIYSLKECKELVSKKGNYKKFSADEITDIHTFKYMSTYKSYKKLTKFISKHYYVQKGNFKIINKFILIPYLETYQLDKTRANIIVSTNIDKYFEFNSEKHKKKFINLVENVALDYPSWNYKGFSERKKN